MAETYFVRDLLLPELDTEIGKTRRLFEALSDGESDFKPYEKSMTLGRLAGHTTDLLRLLAFTLTMSELDMAVAWQPYTMAPKSEMLERFEKNASDALAAFRQSSDETFHQPWRIKRGPNVLFPPTDLPTTETKGSTRSFITPIGHLPSCPRAAGARYVWHLCRRNLIVPDVRHRQDRNAGPGLRHSPEGSSPVR